MKKILILLMLACIITVSGCVEGTTETVTKYVCPDGSMVSDSSSCSIEEQECPDCIDEKAMLDVETKDWYPDIEMEKIYFQYNIYNYGNSEGKSIEVKCQLMDEDEKVLTSKTEIYGNLASRSSVFDFMEASTPDFDKYGEEDMFYALCYITNCINCEILHERIPTLMEEIKG